MHVSGPPRAANCILAFAGKRGVADTIVSRPTASALHNQSTSLGWACRPVGAIACRPLCRASHSQRERRGSNEPPPALSRWGVLQNSAKSTRGGHKVVQRGICSVLEARMVQIACMITVAGRPHQRREQRWMVPTQRPRVGGAWGSVFGAGYILCFCGIVWRRPARDDCR